MIKKQIQFRIKGECAIELNEKVFYPFRNIFVRLDINLIEQLRKILKPETIAILENNLGVEFEKKEHFISFMNSNKISEDEQLLILEGIPEEKDIHTLIFYDNEKNETEEYILHQIQEYNEKLKVLNAKIELVKPKKKK